MEGMGAPSAPDRCAHSPLFQMTPMSATQDERLSQLYRRDPRAEGRFWCSVVTTGVYCRPTCPSRHARPENIRLHDTLAEARATGFRPCERCRPEALSLQERHRRLIANACVRIAATAAPPNVSALAAAADLSPSHFYRLFRRITGTTPSGWARCQKLRAARLDPSETAVSFPDRRL